MKNELPKKIVKKVFLTLLGSVGFGGIATDMIINHIDQRTRNNILSAEAKTTRILNITYYLEETKLFLDDDLEGLKAHLNKIGFYIQDDISLENIVKDLRNKNSKSKKEKIIDNENIPK